MKGIKRKFKSTQNHFFLLGPRGSGKTYWTQTEFPSAFRVDLLNNEIFRLLNAEPELLEKWVLAQNSNTVVIDEIQKIPQILDTVHRLIEKCKDKQFILTGSSARKLRQGGVNLLGGRAANKQMHPYIASELGDLFDFEKALTIGMLPLVWGAHEPQESLKGYATLYLKEEVQAEGIVRNIGNFSRFMEVLTLSQASLMNITNIARECLVPRKTVEGYLNILKDLLLSFHLEVFSKRAQRELKKSPKFYYFDAGVYRSLRPTGYLDSPDEIDGVSLETLVAQHLKAWCDYSDKDNKLYYWQTQQGQEVDFVIYGESGLYAIEVKNSKKISSNSLKGLRLFKKDYPEAKLLCLYRGKFSIEKDGVLCLPCEDFLKKLDPETTLD